MSRTPWTSEQARAIADWIVIIAIVLGAWGFAAWAGL